MGTGGVLGVHCGGGRGSPGRGEVWHGGVKGKDVGVVCSDGNGALGIRPFYALCDIWVCVAMVVVVDVRDVIGWWVVRSPGDIPKLV